MADNWLLAKLWFQLEIRRGRLLEYSCLSFWVGSRLSQGLQCRGGSGRWLNLGNFLQGSGMAEIDQTQLRRGMGNFCTGVVIATGMSAGAPAGFAAQSFVSLSLDPPLVALCPGKGSTSWPKLRDSGHFCINVLAADQRPICDAMARSGGDKFASIEWRAGQTGSPILAGVLGYVDCALEAEHEAGDHTIAVGRIVDFHFVDANTHDGELDPLLFFRGGYGSFA